MQPLTTSNSQLASVILCALCGSRGCFSTRRGAVLARAHIAKELPRIYAQLVAIVPTEFDGVFAYRFHPAGLCRRFEHWQRPRGKLGRFSWLAPRLATFFIAHCAGAGVPQVRKGIAGTVAVFPLNV